MEQNLEKDGKNSIMNKKQEMKHRGIKQYMNIIVKMKNVEGSAQLSNGKN